MPRVISFIVLLAIILLVGAIFFQVMAQFIVPLFLAAVLVVIFEPLYRWMLRQAGGYPRICAGVTTVLILLSVLLPITWLGWRAYVDFRRLLVNAEVASELPDQPPKIARAATKAKDSAPKPAPANANNLSPARATDAIEGAKEVAGADVAAIEDDASTLEATIVEAQHKQGLRRLVDNLTEKVRPILTTFSDWIGIELDQVVELKTVLDRAAGITGSVVLTGVQSAIGIVIGLAIMVISVYYFLADGPAMIRGLMQLSPLDNSYEQELLARFGQVSRAVVVAVLLSAVVQGTLAGIGYAFALPVTAPIFLLTALTMVTAIVPFVGAAAVWIPVCIWVFFYGEWIDDAGIVHEGNWVVALVLATYSTIVVSGIDNLIKPLVLHGQSNLHPLLALLSILGGAQVLGPVGILVGPMLVSFLQALLTMLRKEIDTFDEDEESTAVKLADRDFNVPQNVLDGPGDDDSSPENVAIAGIAVASVQEKGSGETE